jgi:hypothetical protein
MNSIVRGPGSAEHVFLYRNAPLKKDIVRAQLKYAGERVGMKIYPHRLRHSCATLLLNAGAPVTTIQTIPGHKNMDTTLGYARLYDGTVAADTYQAMATFERQLALPEDRLVRAPSLGERLALVDALRNGTLNPAQTEIIWRLRSCLALLAEKGEANVKHLSINKPPNRKTAPIIKVPKISVLELARNLFILFWLLLSHVVRHFSG